MHREYEIRVNVYFFSVNICVMCIHELSFAIKDQDQIGSSPNIIAIPSIIFFIFYGVFSVSLMSLEEQFYFHAHVMLEDRTSMHRNS